VAAAGYDGPLRLGAGGLAWPLSGAVVSPFGPRWGRPHAGIDIASPAGTRIRAAGAGQVVLSGPFGGYGNHVCIQHSARLSTCYAHLSRILVQKDEVLSQGDPVGLVGCTGHCFGDHLPFETRVSGTPVDPLEYL
jgi:peptidoglycan DL-endopeptidase CwlO